MTHDADPPFDALLEHAPFLRRLARGLVRDEARADDLVQDTWAAALRRPPRDPAGARSWLAAVARRLSLDHQKAEGRRAEREARVARDEAQPPGTELDERVELARAVLDAVQSLNEPYRGALWLRYYEDLAPRAIAKRLDVPVETVNTRLRRGKELLRAKLDARYGERRQWLAAMTGLAALREPGLVALLSTTPALAAGMLAIPMLAVGLALAGGGDEPRAEELAPREPVAAGAREERATHSPAAPRPQAAALAQREPAPTVARATREPTGESHAAQPTTLVGSVRWADLEPEGPVHIGLMRATGRWPVGELLAELRVAHSERFELQVPGGGDVLLVAVAQGVPVVTVATELPASGSVKVETVELGAGVPFAGTLLDADLRPMPGARIEARRPELAQGTPEPPTRELGGFELAYVGGAFRRLEEVATSDDEGRFRLFGLGAGPHVFHVGSRADGVVSLNMRHEARPLVADGPDEQLELVWRETRLHVVAADEGGPLDGVFTTFGSFAELSAYAAGRVPRPGGLTLGARGAVSVRFDPADDPALHFERAGHAPALVRLAAATPERNGLLVVELPTVSATASLRLVLESDGAPVADDVLVRMHEGVKSCEEGPPVGLLERPLSPRDGVGIVDDVPPGWYSVEVQPTDGSLLLPARATAEVRTEATLTLRLERGGLVDLVPDRDAVGDVPLALRFHGEDGEPFDAGWIRATELRAGQVARVPRAVPPGEWTVELSRDDALRFFGRARVVAGQVTRVEL